MSEINNNNNNPCNIPTFKDLLIFPIEHTFKVIGEYSMKFCTHVERIFDFHPEAKIDTSMSSGGKYISYSVTIMVKDHDELTDIYTQIDAVPGKRFHV